MASISSLLVCDLHLKPSGLRRSMPASLFQQRPGHSQRNLIERFFNKLKGTSNNEVSAA
jgi:hypothetical protein